MTAQPVEAIHVQGLEKSYQQLHVLRGVDFDVARGSIFALLGSNGAGKTTVVRILSTLLKPDAGTAANCPVRLMDSRTFAGRVATSKPSTAAVPASGVCSVDRILTTVVLPAPLEPCSA